MAALRRRKPAPAPATAPPERPKSHTLTSYLLQPIRAPGVAAFRFVFAAAMAYDALSTDPLYKHWPCGVVVTPGEPAAATPPIAYGVLYDNLAQGSLDFGREISAFRGRYRYYEAEAGDGRGVVGRCGRLAHLGHPRCNCEAPVIPAPPPFLRERNSSIVVSSLFWLLVLPY